jgi:hypothetical protein
MCNEWLLLLSFFFLSYNSFTKSIGNILRISILTFRKETTVKLWKDYRLETFEEIIKEGRKFNVFMTIASQRPSDISATIISQLHNYFLHRLINNNDLLADLKNPSYFGKICADPIPDEVVTLTQEKSRVKGDATLF